MTNYWLDLFTGKTWGEFLKAGGNTSGFRQSSWKSAQKVQPDDVLICYLTGVSRFVGALRVASPAFRDESRSIWSDEDFPVRFTVVAEVVLDPETAVPVAEVLDQFSWASKLTHPLQWTGHFRRSLNPIERADGQMLIEALRSAQRDPVKRAVDRRRLAYRPRGNSSSLGPVIIPEAEPEPADEVDQPPAEATKDASAHTEVQWLLLKLGADMGLDVWVARNDRSREYQGRRFDSLTRLRTELPRQFDPVTSSTIALIDVLWLNKNSIEAAFEIESTTSIYSGLLRMADLIALQPNLKIPLYIVAPDERRAKVVAEVNRPVFRRLDPPMAEICHFLPFSALRENVRKAAPFVRRLDPAIVRDWAEPVALEED
ncbi:hypothetical protein BH24CHL7_BH24CHL7_02090 [soil metagenome]